MNVNCNWALRRVRAEAFAVIVRYPTVLLDIGGPEATLPTFDASFCDDVPTC